MVGRNFIPRSEKNEGWILSLEKHLLTKNYDFLKVNITGGSLKCIGSCKPSDHSVSYTYEIKFIPNMAPSVYVRSPIIEYHEDIHMYSSDKSLCLYYPKDYSWTRTSHLFNTIVPWTHEWFVFYELYLIYGKWLHPAVSHNKNQKLKN
jgi:hypothetical protein